VNCSARFRFVEATTHRVLIGLPNSCQSRVSPQGRKGEFACDFHIWGRSRLTLRRSTGKYARLEAVFGLTDMRGAKGKGPDARLRAEPESSRVHGCLQPPAWD